MKVSRLQRILRLVTILQSGRCCSPNELAGELGISRRTLFRDLNMLEQGGIPYYYDDSGGGYRMDSSFFLPPLNLKLPEALALLLVAQQGGSAGALPLQKEARDAAMKIESVLPAHIRQECGSVLRSTSVSTPARARHEALEQTFSLFQRAIRRSRKVEITYISFYERKQIVTALSPYHLHFAQRAWYVIGHSSLHDEVRTFKLGRIKKVELLPSAYLQDKPFRLANFLGDAWLMMPEGKIYDVKLRFSEKVAGNIAEVLWHRKQRVTWLDDGRLIFEVKVDGLAEIFWWIAGYGDQVEVLSPAILKKRIARLGRNIVAMYERAED